MGEKSKWEKAICRQIGRSISDSEMEAAVAEKRKAEDSVNWRKLKRRLRQAMMSARKKEISS